MNNLRKISILGLILSLGLVACGDDDTVVPDAAVDMTAPDGDTPDGTVDATLPDGAAGEFAFSTMPASAYTRTDRMGMPAVSTAFLGEMKAAYNADSPVNDIETIMVGELELPKWAPAIATGLGGLLRGDGTAMNGVTNQLATLGLTSCEDTAADVPFNALPCATQTIGDGGPTVLSVVVPDTLSIDLDGDPGFPNGRRLADQAMDVTLAVVVLDLTMHSHLTFTDLNGAEDGTPSLNPAANDVDFLDAFPYLAAAQ